MMRESVEFFVSRNDAIDPPPASPARTAASRRVNSLIN